MFWKIIRPGYWIWRRRLRSTNQLLLFLIVTGVVVAGYFAIDFLFSQIGDALANDAIVDVIAAFLPIQLYVFLLFAVLGIGDVLNQLYYASDLQFLFVAPIPLRITYFIKLLQAARGTIVPALLLGGFLISFGLAQQLSWIYYPILILLILALMAITPSFSIILVVLMVRFMPSKGMSSAMPVVVFILTLGLVLG